MKLFPARIKKNKGYSLIEVLLVLVILAAVFLPLIQILSRIMIASQEAKGTNTAVKLAQAKLEQIKNVSYNLISSEAKTDVSASSIFDREVIVTEPSSHIKNIKVIVYWPSGEGSELSIEVESLVRDNEE